MTTIIKPNDLIDQILAIAAELTPVAEHCGVARQWGAMLTERTARTADLALVAITARGAWTANGAHLIRAADHCTSALLPGRTFKMLQLDLLRITDTRASLEPLLAELRKVPA